MRWLLVAENGWGLGHVSRQLGLARSLRRLRPDDEYLFLTWSEACHLIWRDGFNSLKLPSMARTRPERLLSGETRWWLTRSVLQACGVGYRPHAIVVDTFPAGTVGQLGELLTLPALRVLIARENRYLSTPIARAALPAYQLAVAPHVEGEVELGLPVGLPVHHVGPILVRGRDEALPRAVARSRLGLPAEGLVCLVTFGGGGNPRVGEAVRWVAEVAAERPEWTLAVAEGPLSEEALAGVEEAPRLRRVRHYPLAEMYAAFDLAVSATGSSAYELAHHRVPAVLVPGANELRGEDHPAKARRIAAGGAGRVVGYGDGIALAAALDHYSDPVAREHALAARRVRDMPEGSARAADIIVEALLARHAAAGQSAPDESPDEGSP